MFKNTSVWYNLLVIIFIVNFIFWTFIPHSTHCVVENSLGVTTCTAHEWYVAMSIICFLLVVWMEYGGGTAKF
jgi:hypothetical protein